TGAGTIRSTSGNLIFHHHAAGVLDVDMQVVSGGDIVKTGPGKLRFNHINNSTGTIFINDGTLCVATNGNLGALTGTVYINGGTLEVTDGFSSARNFILYPDGGTFQVNDDAAFEITGVISTSGNYSELRKTGTGTLRLSGANTYAGATHIEEGVLQVGYVFGLSYSITNNNHTRATAPFYVRENAALDVAGFSPAIGCVTLDGGALTDSVGGGSLSSYRFNILSGVVDVPLADTILGNNSVFAPMKVNIYKTTDGDAFINSDCTLTGNIFVDGGTLHLNGSVGGAAHVRDGGTLAGGGDVGRTLLVFDGGTLFPSGMTVGRDFGVFGGTFKALVTADGAGGVTLTSPDARVILDNATLDLRVASGVSGFEYTLIENMGSAPVQGEFNGLPEGAMLDAGGKRFAISYRAGSGSDTVLRRIGIETLIIVR
ncbi:MAG: autotransporter-associated beta strand repeat-containing protein, partial [Kiritimatiellaeota bacterium]|nr:autotransporter-associated beta strand repeat-containing protein [Kiritimatiellota bacterium]